MNLPLLVLFTIFAFAIGGTVPPATETDKISTNNVPEQVASDNQAEPIAQDASGDKKVVKRSYGWSPWGYGGYSYGWPWYSPGHGFYAGGWYPGWPIYYGHGYGYGYGYGYGHGGWYKGW